MTQPPEERVKKKIFDNQLVEQLLVEFRRTNDGATYQRVCMESMNLIDSIIRGNKFYKQAPFHEIRNFIFTQFHKWCDNWHPDKAKIYSYLSACGEKNTRVTLADGSKLTLGEIVEGCLPVEVRAWDEATNSIVARKVIDWSRTPVAPTTIFNTKKKSTTFTKEWAQVMAVMPCGIKRKMYFTWDHKFFTQRGWVELKDVVAGKDSLAVDGDVLTKEGQEAVMGILMGDGHLSKAGYMVVGHGLPQQGYAEWLAHAFGTKTRTYTPKAGARSCFGLRKPSVSFHVNLNKVWPEFAAYGFPRCKGVTPEMLELLTDRSLAFWYMDDGSLGSVNKNLFMLHTESFSSEAITLIQGWFKEKYGVTLKFRKRPGKEYGFLIGSVKESVKIWGAIAKYILPEFKYKLPPKWQDTPCELSGNYVEKTIQWTSRFVIKAPGKHNVLSRYIKDRKVKQVLPDFKWKYDITVEGAHSFFAEDVLVHNCIKNGCISYVTKDGSAKKRHVFTDVPLDSVGLMEDVSYSHYHLSDDDLVAIQNSVEKVMSRWKEPVIRECLRYMVTVILQKRISRRTEVLQSAVWGYGIPLDTAKFLFDWSLGSVRGAMLEHWDSPIGEADIIRAAEKFSFIPDMANLVGWKNVRKIMTVFQGMTVKFPTVSTLRKAFAVREIYNQSDFTPAKMERIGKAYGISSGKISEVFEEVSSNIQAGVMEDDPLFETTPEEEKVEVPYYFAEFGATPDDFDYPASD